MVDQTPAMGVVFSAPRTVPNTSQIFNNVCLTKWLHGVLGLTTLNMRYENVVRVFFLAPMCLWINETKSF